MKAKDRVCVYCHVPREYAWCRILRVFDEYLLVRPENLDLPAFIVTKKEVVAWQQSSFTP